MAELNTREGPRQHLYVLHRHVLGPLSTALEIAERERAEIASEREAFEEFADRVERLSPVRSDAVVLPLGNGGNSPTKQRTEDLRQAYRETFMAVPHYDDVYGETLDESVTAEFGPALAQLFRADSTATFSAQKRTLLTSAAKKQERKRDDFHDVIASEVTSLRSTRRELSSLLDNLDSSVVPAWYRTEFEDRLDSIQTSRQEALYDRSMPASYDSHTLCSYLYGEEPWTYPGLTAAARLLDSVVLRDR